MASECYRFSSGRSLPYRFEQLEDRLALTTFTVNRLVDAAVNLGDSAVTLRDAISAAHNDVPAFPGGPAGDPLASGGSRPGLREGIYT